MSRILNALNREWSDLAGSTPAREAVTRWSRRYPVFGGAADLHDVVDLGHLSDTGDVVRRALAEMAHDDDLAARTLLQALLGGITTMAIRCAINTDSTDELVAIAGTDPHLPRTPPRVRRGQRLVGHPQALLPQLPRGAS